MEGRVEHSAVNEPAPGNSDTVARISRWLVRCGWCICGVGLPVTVLGNHLIAAGGKSPSAFSQSVHLVGLVIMLLGLLAVLAGYRTPWFVNQLAIQEQRKQRELQKQWEQWELRDGQ